MKKGTKRKILYIFLGIILVLGITAFLLAKTGVFVKQFKNIIEAELSKALNREVTVEKIEGGVFDSIDLIKVRIAAKKEIKDGILIEIDKVSIKYSFKDIIFNKKEVIDSLKGIEIIRPSVLMEKDESGTWNIVEFFNSLPVTENSPLPEKLTITVTKGLLVVKDGKKKFNSSLRDIYGQIDFLRGGKFNIKAATKSYFSKKDNLFVDGVIDLKNKTSALVVNGKDLDLAHYSSYVLAHLENNSTVFTGGLFNLKANIFDAITAEVLIKNGSAKVQGTKSEFSGIIAEINFDKDKMTVKKMASVIKSASITGKGEINNYLTTTPAGKLNIYVNRLDLSEFSHEDFLKGLNPRGLVNAGIVFEGNFASPAVSIFANARDLSLAGVKTDNNELVLRYKNRKANIESLKIYAFDGIAKLSGKYDLEKDSLLLVGEASDMQAKEILELAGVPGAAGRAAFTFEAKGPLKNLTIASKAKIKNMSLVSGSLSEVSGDLLFYDNGKLRVNAVSSEKITMQTLFTFKEGKAYTDGTIKLIGANFKNVYGFFVENKLDLAGESYAQFTMKGQMNDITLSGDVLIDNFNFEGYRAKTAKGNLKITRGMLEGAGLVFNQDDKGYLKADGSMGLTGEMLFNVAVSATNVDFSKIPVFNNYYKMAGRGAFAGKILGNISYPKFITTLSSENMVLDNKQSFSVELSFTYNNSILKVDRLNLDNEYTFSGEFALLKETHIDSVFTAKQGKLETLFTVFKVPYKQNEVKGTLSGNVNLSGNFDSLNGEGDLKTENTVLFGNSIKTLNITFGVKEGLFNLTNFTYNTAGLEIAAGGTISLKDKGLSSLNIAMKNLYEKTVVQGNYNITATGLFDPAKTVLSGKIKSGGVIFNGVDTGRADAEIAYNKATEKFSFKDLRWGKLLGNFEYAGLEKSFQLSLKFDGTDIKKFALLDKTLINNNITGLLTGDLGVKVDNKGVVSGENIITITNARLDNFKANRITVNTSFIGANNGYKVTVKRLLLSQESGSVEVSGALQFDEKFSPEKSDCDLSISVLSAEIKNLLPLIKSQADVSAKLSALGISARGKLSNPEVAGAIKASDVRAGNLFLGDFAGEFSYKNNTLDFKKLVYDDLTLDNHAKFEKAAFVFKKDVIEAQIKALADFKKLLGLRLKARVETAGFKIPLTDNGRLESEIYLKELFMNDYKMADFSVRALGTKNGLLLSKSLDTREEISFARGELIFKDPKTTEFKGVEISLLDNTKGQIKLNGVSGQTSSLTIDVSNVNVRSILKYLDVDLNMTGTVNHATALYRGDAILPSVKIERGSLSGVKIFDLSFGTVIGDLNVENNKIYLAGVEGVEHEYKDGATKVVYKVNVDGTIPINQEDEQNLHIVLKNTGLQPIMMTGWFNNVEGIMDGELFIKGKLSYPIVSTRDTDKDYIERNALGIATKKTIYAEDKYFTIKKGAKVFPLGFIREVDNMNAIFSIDKNDVKILEFRAEVDKSPLEAIGSFSLKKFYPDELKIKIKNTQTADRKGFKFKIGSIMQKEGTMFAKGYDDEFFSLSGIAPDFKLSGEIHVYDTRFFWPPDYKDGEEAPKVLKQMDWNLKVVMEENVWYYNNYCEAKLKIGSVFTSSGLGSDLTMRGKADIERGYFNFYTGKFDIKTASFSFLETEKRQPTIKAFCEYDAESHKIFMEVRGTNGEMAELGNEKNFDLVFTSQPEESKTEILRILGGFGSSAMNSDSSAAIQQALVILLSQPFTKAAEGFLGENTRINIVRAPARQASMGEIALNSDILEGLKLVIQKPIGENLTVDTSLFRKSTTDLNNTYTSVLIPQVDLSLVSGNKIFNVGVNPEEVVFGARAVIVFDNEMLYNNEKRKGK